MIPTLEEYVGTVRKHLLDAGAITLDLSYGPRHPEYERLANAYETSDPTTAAILSVPSYWWGHTMFDRKEFVRRWRAGTVFEYEPAVFDRTRFVYSPSYRRLRVIFTLKHPNPDNLETRRQWIYRALVYVPNDKVWKERRREMGYIMLEAQRKTLEKIKQAGDVLPKGGILQP
jgi:hypothetical protein